MATLLEQQVIEVLTAALGRAPTAEEIRLGTLAPYPLSDIHNTANIAQNTISISDTDDIQDALDKIETNGGGVVYLNPGTYNVSSDIILPSNTNLVGLVKSICVIDFGGGSYSIISDGGSQSKIQDLTITDSSDAGIKFSNNTGVLYVDGVLVTDCAYGIYCNSVSGLNIEGNGLDVITCGTGMRFDTMVGLTITNSSVSRSTVNGIEIVDATFVVISASSILLSGSDGLSLDNVDSASFDSIFLSNNTGDGVNLIASASANRFYGCSITNNTGYGINITQASDTGNMISINNFFNNTSGAVNDSGTSTLIRSNIGVADN